MLNQEEKKIFEFYKILFMRYRMRISSQKFILIIRHVIFAACGVNIVALIFVLDASSEREDNIKGFLVFLRILLRLHL